jgi:hypothetical protein
MAAPESKTTPAISQPSLPKHRLIADVLDTSYVVNLGKASA